ncbi:MAG: deoxyribodipyrimidine photo-lyase [Chloroflexi bacterium]|nr:deoxyribodipyrimidine photo-lyase [Chloroflexota bacterium]
MSNHALMWFRRDLRLNDNLALQAVAESGATIVPIFVLDPAILKSPNTGASRLSFLLKALRALDEALQRHGSRLWVAHGDPALVLAHLVERFDATALYFNHDYSPYARQRDRSITEALSIPVYGFDDGTLNTPGTIMKDDGEPYIVFSPFKRKWQTLERRPVAAGYLDTARFYHFDTDVPPVPDLSDLGFAPTMATPPADEATATNYLNTFMAGAVYHYGESRNRLVAEPWHYERPGSSYLSPYLRLGMLSPRQAYWAARKAYEQADSKDARKSVESYVSELVWREFYMHILYHYPRVLHSNFRAEYNLMAWVHQPEQLQAWKDGRTGYPVVDAAMRQLKAIGWMPNRARMIVGSFLTKDLLIDWREGERHFMQWLIDGDPAANNGGWQWVAGTGTDAQPYFRIFNPVSQSQRHDPEGEYICHWIPELRDVPTQFIHTPWEMDQPPVGYPQPIIDHHFARQRAIDAHKAVKDTK